ncbi:hypothetical protein SY27_13275 [Flavobacterium sp. 316]|uniref:hypothetical protein n=1 Tax=Flavobacterium sp. 316 TaxID=1603293 RepID=UPI0005E0AA7C|nr:hypothetical protein [Flavobacterium sp. 316]KIX20842.1 hypothetical protein SY27_13275 [Flavobacterium sp. 316]
MNGNILNSDAQAVTSLIITGNTVTNFTGLEAFVNVVTLNLGPNPFATVPLTTLTSLESLQFTGNDMLNSLDLSQNILLNNLNIQSNTSVIGEAPIVTLNLANNINLINLRINRFTNLSNLILPVTTTLIDMEFFYKCNWIFYLNWNDFWWK